MPGTIGIKIKAKPDITMEDMDLLKKFIIDLRSPWGNRYCDILEESRNDERGLNIKLSYPRYYFENNAYLISGKSECFEVQEHFINSIMEDPYFKQIVIGIQLVRVDIPFTYYMPEGTDFHSYVNVYRIFAEVYNRMKPNARPKVYMDVIDERYETLVYSDNGKTDKSSNNRLMIYNQYQNLKNKLGVESMAEVERKYSDLKYRMRMEE